MTKYFVYFFIFLSTVFAQNVLPTEKNSEEIVYFDPKIDCLILEDENSIICKFEISRNLEDEKIETQWISPSGEISRTRDVVIPSGHGSIYDYRYIEGRESGMWFFKVIHNEKEYSTQFELK